MQKDSMHFSTSGHMTHDQAANQESPIKSFQCSHCTLIFKSKVSLFEHLNQAHGLDIDAALRGAGLKNLEANKASTDNDSNDSGDAFECQHCDFKACVQDVLSEHEKQCPNKSENHTSDAKCLLNSSKDLKTYNRSLQTITKYFTTSSGSNGKIPLKLAEGSMFLDGTKETLILKESPSDSSANSSGVFKVTAQPTIDISKPTCDRYLLDDHLVVTELRPPKPKEKIKETVHKNVGKRTNDESSKTPPAKKAKSDKEKTKLQEKANASKQESSNNTEFSFEFSEDEEEKKVNLVNGSTERPEVYVCKHCDYSHMSIKRVSNHYQNDHPYIIYNARYIQDPSDQSATFRCLECPVEFLNVTSLKRHYMENHPEAPDVFTVQSRELCLVFKCFVCPFTSKELKALKEHYRGEHPTHKMDNSLMYHRYSATRRPERPSQLNMCEKAPSPERLQEISHETACTPCKEVTNAPSPQHPTSKSADVALYHCNYCKFNHKSIVVMHVHYQKSHPDEAVTMDKIKQAAHVTLHTTLQMMPEKSPNSPIMEKSTPQKNISDSSMETRDELSHKKEISLSLINPPPPGASETHSESAKTNKVEFAEDRSKRKKLPTKRYREMSTGLDGLPHSSPDALFYCQLCNYSSTKIKSVIGHHNAKHAAYAVTGTEEILWYSAEVRKKKLQSITPKSSSVSKTKKQGEVCSEKELQNEEDEARDASVMEYNDYACAENLFYCQKCNYGNTSVQRVLNHQAKVHHSINTSMDRVIEHTALIRDEIKKSKSQAKKLPFSTHLPLPILNEGDEDAFFCHFCNYRHRTLSQVLKHYLKKHRGFVAKGQQVRLYSSMVLTQTQESHLTTTASQEVNHASLDKKGAKKKKTKKLGKVSVVPQRTLQCHRCQYGTQYVYLLKRHMLKTHKAKHSVTDVLRMCFNQGTLQIGYHCDLCVFSHKKASAVCEHYQEQHPGRRPSLQYVTNRLYVGPETSPPAKKKPQTMHSDGINDSDGTLPHQKSGQSETKIYPCRACSFKGSSASSIVSHYHAVHPWTVKEDGSVLDVINSKRWSANRQVEGHHEVPVPSEYSPDSSHEKAASSRRHKCPYCPARFLTHRGLKTHCGMKHQEAVDEKQVQSQTRVHVFKCPHCPYFNTRYHGVLTHCQMRHPALPSRADSLHIDEEHFHNWEHYLKRAGPDFRLTGYMCKTCPKIYKTLEKLNKHCEKVHDETAANTASDSTKSAPDPPAVSNKTHNSQGSLSKASFLRKKMYPLIKCQYCSYSCTTKLGLGRHLHVHHKNASQDYLYKCELCSSSFFRKALLRNHYAKKHGKEASVNFCEPPHKHEKPASTVPDCLSTQQPEEASNSSTTEEEKKILVYKCPSCPYVNASYHGTLTHCQMKHPDVRARADELKTDEIFVTNMVRCTIGKGYNERGYMCKKCPQIHVSLKKLKVHSDRDHYQPEATASEHSFESETEKQPDHGRQESILKKETNTASVQQKESVYKCHICTYMGSCRRYLHCHYKKTHKFDAFTTYKLLEKYNKRKRLSNLPEPESEESVHVKCKMCPDLKFESSQLLIAHYSTFHSSDRVLDFVVLSQASKKSTGLYKCALCKKQMNGIRRLCLHLDSHREMENKMAEAAKTKASPVITATPEAKSIKLCGQNDLPMLESVEELAEWNVKPVETFALPSSPLLSPSKPNDPEKPELEDKHTCKQCRRTFMSLKGLRSHERSHAALAAIKKKLGKLSTSALKHNNIDQHIIYKAGTMRPFLCSLCSYRTTVMGLWRCHFLKVHQSVIINPVETGNQDEESAQRANKELLNPSDELMNLSELDEETKITEKLLYLEPPDVQRQLNHYSLMAGVPSKAIMKETKLPENNVFHCEVCNFHTGHLSSMRRHYLNRHGKKILRCKDCSFFTSVRKTLEMHMAAGHSTCRSGPNPQKDLNCPFCLYQTKNKNNMIDHIVLHREERVVPIEVRRPKLSRYLQGIVFRCHKCTFSSGSAENLRLHMMRHNDIKPYKCRLCYFDCTRLSDLEAHLNNKHQVVRNHELVGQISLDQLEARLSRMPQEEAAPSSNLEQLNIDSEDVKTEEFVTDCDEVPPETQAKNLTENNIKDNITLKIKEAYQKQGQYSKNGNEESDAKSSILDTECKNTKPNTIVQEKHEQDPQEQAETVFLPDAARGQEIENIVEQNVAEGNNADIQCEDFSCPEKETQINENQALVKPKEDSSVMFTQQKEEAAEGSSETCGKIAERAHVHKLHIKALKHREVNIEASVEDDLLRRIILLDEDGSISKIHKKTDQDRMIKTEQKSELEVNVLSEILPLNKDDSITLDHGRKKKVCMKAISTSAKTSNMQANKIRAQERFTVERSLLTLPPSCRQLKRSREEMLDVSFPNCKEEQLQNNEEVRDPYGEMPVLENVYLKEEINPLGCCKEEDDNDHLAPKQDKEDEMVTDDENQGTNRIKEADNPHVPRGALAVMDGAADVLCPAATEGKQFTCRFCGRNLKNSSELERHVMRHGI